MSPRRLSRWLLAAALLLPLAAAAKEIELPEDGISWQPSPLPGFEAVRKHCSGCHSAHYAAYQPPTTPRGYWEAQVKRMKAVFKAPVPEDQLPLIVDYLVKTYGAEAAH